MPEPARDAVALMVTEVVSNAVLHGCSSARDEVLIEVRAGDQAIAIAVHDPGVGTDVSAARDGGFGLSIVDQLATRWGMEHEPAGTLVWFELAVAG